MPVAWAVQDGVLVVTLPETCSTGDIRRAMAAFAATPDFTAAIPVLLDVRSSIDYIALDEMGPRLESIVSLGGPGRAPRCAVVSAPARLAMSRRLLAYADIQGTAMRVFTDMEAARTWVRAAGTGPEDASTTRG
jgi:hypothetical protein